MDPQQEVICVRCNPAGDLGLCESCDLELKEKRFYLEKSPDGVDFQQTTNSYFIVTSHPNIYYKGCGFRKNATFPKRLAERTQSTKLDYLTFLHVQNSNFKFSKNLPVSFSGLFLNISLVHCEIFRRRNKIVRKKKKIQKSDSCRLHILGHLIVYLRFFYYSISFSLLFSLQLSFI
jgi:hypothetical protein